MVVNNLADGSINFDTSVDASGVSKAGNTITAAFRKVAKEAKSALGIKDNSKIIAQYEQQAQKAKKAAETAETAYNQQIQKIDEYKRKLEELKAQQSANDSTELAAFQPSKELKSLDFKRNFYAREYEKNPIQYYKREQLKAEEQYNALLKQETKEYEKQKAIFDTQKAKKSEQLGAQITDTEGKIQSETAKLYGLNQKISETAANAKKAEESLKNAVNPQRPTLFGKALGSVSKNFKQVTHRISGLAKRVLIFSVITRALNALRKMLTSFAQSDPQIAASLQKIKGNLLTAFQPLWESVLPALRQIIAAIETATARLAQISASIFGKSPAQMSKNAKAMYEQANATKEAGEAAEEASKSLAGFDEINQLGEDDKGSKSGAGASGADFSGTSDLGELDKKTALIASYGMLILGTACLLAGIGLVNIPLIIVGIGLIKAGLALGKNSGAFDSVPDWVHNIITWGLMIAGTAMLIIGIATVNIPLIIMGLAVMAIGIGYGSSTGVFEGVPNWVNQIITWGLMIAGTVMLVVGIAMGNIPLAIAGLGMLGMSIAYGIKSGAFDEAVEAVRNTLDKIKKVVSEKWQALKDWWHQNITPIIDQFKYAIIEVARAIKAGVNGNFDEMKQHLSNAWTAIKNAAVNAWNLMWNGIKGVINKILGGIERFINGIIDGINKLIAKLNALTASMPDWVKEHTVIGNFNVQPIGRVTLPRLATGTVVPANYGEFAAILGDNKRETEVVSPLSTMKQAFAEVMASYGGGIAAINLTIANRTISEATIEYINGKTKQLGVNVIKGV